MRTTATMKVQLNGIPEEKKFSSVPLIALKLPKALQHALDQIPEEMFCHEDLVPVTASVSVISFGKIFSKLNSLRETKKLTEKQLAALEEYRLHLMKRVCKELKKHESARLPANIVSVEEETFFSRLHVWLKENCPLLLKILFGLFFTLGLCFEAVFYYVGFAEMLGGLVTSLAVLTNPITLVVCGILTGLNLILYFAFDGSLLGEMFGVKVGEDEKKKLDAYDEQITVANEINRLLCDFSVRSNATIKDYICYSNFGIKCNDMIVDRQIDFTDCKESPKITFIRWSATILGALLTLGGGYFSGLAILPALGLLASPWGAVFVGVLMLSMFIAFFAMQGRGIAHLLSPNLDKKKEVREHLNKFSPKEDVDFRALMDSKRTLEAMSPTKVENRPEQLCESQSDSSRTDEPESDGLLARLFNS